MKNGWEFKRLRHACQIIMGTSPPGDTYNTTGEGMPLVNGPVEFGEGSFGKTVRSKFTTAPNKVCKADDLILCVRGSTTGKMNIAGFDACIGRGVAAIRAKEYQPWINYFIHAKRDDIYNLGTGATFPNISAAALGDLELRVPPLAEQRRIVGILDAAFAGIATATAHVQQNLQNARALFESYLHAAFSERGDGWKDTTLGAEIDLLTGFPFKSAQYTNSDKSVRLLRGDNIVQGSLRWDDVKKWPNSDIADYERYELRAGDVVLAMDRPWVNAGLKRARLSEDDLPCLLVQRTARLRGNGSLDNGFLLYLISSATFIHHILGVQTGIGVPHISGQQIKDFPFLKPPLTEQRKVVATLDRLSVATQQLETLYQRKLAALAELKQALLHQAFSGQL